MFDGFFHFKEFSLMPKTIGDQNEGSWKWKEW